MATLSSRLPQNIAGVFYVDDTCVDCDLCRSLAPEFFQRDEIIGQSFVFRQPVTSLEIEAAGEAMTSCPTESIGNDTTASATPGTS